MENSKKLCILNTANVFRLRNSLILFILFTVIVPAIAQETKSFEAYKAAYKGQPEVVISDVEKYVIKKAKNGLLITQERHKESLVLNKLGVRDQKDQFYSSELSPVMDYNAYIITKDNKKVKMKNFNESSNNSGSVFFDDVKKIEVTYSGLEPGVRKVLQYETTFTDPNLLHRFVFKRQYAAEELKLEVEVDNSVELGYKVINDSGDIEFQKTKKGKKTLYQWVKKNSTPYKWEPNSPGMLYVEPHVALFITDAELDEKPIFLGDVPKLYAYYQTFVKDLNKDINKDLQTIAETIAAPHETEEEKVKAIYYWVKDNIKYIAYENGYEGFIPREANLVCERKFGDCKDMSSITQALCQSIGIDNVKLTWIGTRDIPYTYEEVPTPAVDNHMIACYVKDDSYIFLDGTDQWTAYPYPSSFIQGKEALVGLSPKEFKIVTVPIVDAIDNKRKIEVDFTEENGLIKGTGSFEFHGLSRTRQLATMSSLNKTSKFNDVKRRVLLGNNKFILSDYTEENIDNRDLPYILHYDFNLDNYVIEVGDEHFINMFMKEHSLLYEMEDDRIFPYEIAHLQHIDVTTRYTINDTESINSLPEPLDIDNDLLSFKAAYSMDGRTIQLHYILESKSIFIEPSQFEEWNNTIRSIKEYMDNTLSIKQQ